MSFLTDYFKQEEKNVISLQKEKERRKVMEEQYRYIKEYEKIQSLPAPKPYPGGGGAAASGGGFQQGSYHAVYSDSHVRSSVDVGSLIKEAVEEAAKEFKLVVETMQEQIDELWEVIRELEDED